MVWREAYATKVLDAPELVVPPLTRYGSGDPVPVFAGAWVWLAGPDVPMQLKLGVWLRLLDSLENVPPRVISTWSGEPSRQDRALWEAVVPRSQQPLWTWMDANPIGEPVPLFAAAMHGDTCEILMLGAPTESAWDAFQDALAKAEARGR